MTSRLPALFGLPLLLLLSAGVVACASSQPSVTTSRSSASPPGSSSPSAVGSPLSQPPASAVTISPTVAQIARLQATIQANPDDATAQRDLGVALLQRVRETADPTLYEPAQAALDAARRLSPDDPLVLVGIGGLQLGKHRFADALATGQKAVELGPSVAAAHAVVVDALVELGRYDEADAAGGRMLAIRSDLSTLARVSYLAELRGHFDIALAGMRLAAKSPGAAPENTAYVDTLLGNLLVYTGDRVGARTSYEAALALVPNHAPALAGLGRLAVGDGNLDAAIPLFKKASEIVPLPEYVIALGDAQTAVGQAADAADSYDLAKAEIQLFQASGVVVDQDLALFEADHGDPERAVEFARKAHDVTPTVRAADALAWALHRAGRDREAEDASTEALRLGWRDPLALYHAGAIAAANGDGKHATTLLGQALAIDPGFSATAAAEARRILATIH